MGNKIKRQRVYTEVELKRKLDKKRKELYIKRQRKAKEALRNMLDEEVK